MAWKFRSEIVMTYFWFAYCIKKLPTSDIYKCDKYFFSYVKKKIKVELKVGKGREKLKKKHACLEN